MKNLIVFFIFFFSLSMLSFGKIRIAALINSKDANYSSLRNYFSKKSDVKLIDLVNYDISNPIEKGDLLSKLYLYDLLILTNNSIFSWGTKEIEDMKILGLGDIPFDEKNYNNRFVKLIFNYSKIEDLLKSVALYFPEIKNIGIVFGENSEPYLTEIINNVEIENIKLNKYKFIEKKHILKNINKAIKENEAYIFVPDKNLLKMSVFNYVMEKSLIYKKPIFTPLSFYVKKGAAMSLSGSNSMFIENLNNFLDDLMKNENSFFEFKDQFTTGKILKNDVIIKKYGLFFRKSSEMLK